MAASAKQIGIVVPTLGTRTDKLHQCLESIRHAGDAHISLVAPAGFDYAKLLSVGLIDQYVEDPMTGLANAINAGISALPKSVKFVNWLGDDDLLSPSSLIASSAELADNPKAVMVYGSCQYLDESGEPLWLNRSGPWAAEILRIGPDLIPQPGALFLRGAFEAAGGLKDKYKLAFDYDLFLELKTLGKLIYLPVVLASFRWHPGSLSVEDRKVSVDEASKVRVSHQSAALRLVSWIWEPIVRYLTLKAGLNLTKKAGRIKH